AGLSDFLIASAANDVSGSDGIGINLVTDWSTGGAESGNIKVTLIHEPANKTGTTRSSIGGETDIELTFPTTVQ
ncbi:MAG: type 1 periplasmic binding fold superfamily protein, partial [Bacteroidota bacterium]|nr:type 1 periplasmic binding fold superfamily protein [Bacteroidota bacterium]